MTNVVNIVNPMRLPAPNDDGTLMQQVQDLVSGNAPELDLRRSLTPGGVVTGLTYSRGIAPAIEYFISMTLWNEDGRNFFQILVFHLEGPVNPRLSTDSATTQFPLEMHDAWGQAFIQLPVVLPDIRRRDDNSNDAWIRVRNTQASVLFQCSANAVQFAAVSRFFMNVVRAALNMDPL